MAQTRIVYYQEPSGQVPMQRWLNSLPKISKAECRKAIRQLEESGRELRFPHICRLQDGIYELRVRVRKLRYRIFYFWHGGAAVVFTHGIAKKVSAVPRSEITRALRRKRRFEQNPTLHTEETNNG